MPAVDKPTQQPELSILTVSYNCPEEVEACYESLLQGGGEGVSWEFLVCENGSDRLEEMRSLARLKGFRLIEPGSNLGFGRANNLLFQSAVGRNVLFLNPDTIVPPGVCRKLLNGLQIEGCMISAPLLTNADGSFQFSWNVPMGLGWEFCEVHYLQNQWRVFFANKFSKCNPHGPWEVGFSSGACLCMEANTFARHGGFDEEFFLNHEDIELCDRIRQYGKVLVFPDIVVRHLDGGTQRKNWKRFVKDRLEAKRIYLRKRYTGIRRILAQCLWLEGVLLRIVISSLMNTDESRSRKEGYSAALVSLLKRSRR